MSIYTRMKAIKEKEYAGSYSDFWLPKESIQTSIFDNDRQVRSAGFADLGKVIQMSGVQKAVSNFVRILTGRPIPVKFYTGGAGFTDGKTVTISGNTEKLDSIVGLALHEASHCLLTDFDLVHYDRLRNRIPSTYYTRASALNVQSTELISIYKNLFNWMEDRRIDNYIYTTAPGYRGYYHALYFRFFNNDIIAKGLMSTKYRDETFDSYFFRILNLTNASSDLDALRGLRRISSIIDLPNIGRLDNSDMAATVALEILEVMLNCCEMMPPKKKQPKQDKSPNQQKGEPQSGMGAESDDESESSDGNDSDEQSDDDSDEELSPKGDGNDSEDSSETGDDDEQGSGSSSDDDSDEQKDAESKDGQGKQADEKPKAADLQDEVTEGEEDLKDADVKKLEKQIEQQKEFLEGDVGKKKVNQTVAEAIDAVSKSGSSIVDVTCGDVKVPVTTIRVVTDELFNTDSFPYSQLNQWSVKGEQGHYNDQVAEGIVLGTLLGRKLQIRNDEKQTKYSRKETGRIDRKLLAELGCDNTSVFSRMAVERFDKAFIHLSIDVSGSMSGNKMGKAIKTAVAIAKFASMTQNIDVQISVRASLFTPIVAIMYDSRKDKFSKVARQFPYLRTDGSTPEGLTFAAIAKEIPNPTDDLKVYFINFSDGEPGFNMDLPKTDSTVGRRRGSGSSFQYSGYTAHEHTKGEIAKFIQRGMKILSYFISSHEIDWSDTYGSGGSATAFKTMYGQAASFVDAQKLPLLAKSLEEMFAKKS